MKRAFTLIELLVVISILGLLASVVLVSMEGAEDRAVIGKAMEFSHVVRVSLGADLVGEWHFDDEANPTQDSSGYDNHGDLVNFTVSGWTDQGVFKKALMFDGADDYVNCGSDSSIFLENNFTWEFWFKANSITHNTFVMSFYGERFSIRFRSDGNWKLSIRDYLNSDNVWGDTTIQPDKWYHVVVTKSSSNGDKIYLNGALDGECGACTSDTELVSSEPLWLGSDKWGCIEQGYSDWFDGTMDEVRIYNQALSSTEIQHLYVQGAVKHNIVLK